MQSCDFRTQYREHIEKMLGLLGDADRRRRKSHSGARDRHGKDGVDPRGKSRPAKDLQPPERPQTCANGAGDRLAGLPRQAGMHGPVPIMIVSQPDYLHELSGLLKETPLSTWRSIFGTGCYRASPRICPRPSSTRTLRSKAGVLHDTPKITERWKRGCELVDDLVGEASGKLYVAKYFPPKAKSAYRRSGRQPAQSLRAKRRSIVVDERGHQGRSAGQVTQDQCEGRLSEAVAGLFEAGHFSRRSARKCVARGAIRKVDRKLAASGGAVDRDRVGK